MPFLVTIKDPDLVEDPEFPHDNTSIGGKLDRTLRWIPARRLNPNATLSDWHLFDGIEPADLLQGSAGDCWLIAAMAVLSEFPQAVRQMFVMRGKEKKGLPRNGMYTVRLFDYRRNAFSDITVDEYVPYQPLTGLCEFAKPHGNEVWVLMVEKAMAKMFGSYSDLEGLNPGVAFRAFIGEQENALWEREELEPAAMRTALVGDASWKESMLKPQDVCYTRGQQPGTKKGSEMFEMLRVFSERNYLLCASIKKSSPARMPEERRARRNTSSDADHVRADGLVEGHTYSILAVAEVEGKQLLKLRNPWGNDREWTGAWSDKDSKWSQNPAVREKLRPDFGPDGIFWMCWQDFCRSFSSVYVCMRAMHGRAGADSPEGVTSKRLTLDQRREFATNEVHRLFKLRDKNSDEFLDEQELREIMRDLGMNGEQAAKLLAAADKNKDGKIDVQEFLEWVLGNKTKNQKLAMGMAVERGVRREQMEKSEKSTKATEADKANAEGEETAPEAAQATA
eukprot:TRINITY_DN94333_c0_g1_i1.p1 TRINITY_DN94333_c0_g1~~TRINITY_DN94333_c0_g1_i1.p1  ORF type:complete len:508 (-),score=110.71 TRINITY_DN94333_c0_g1_i1:110-1633(-)